MEKRIILTAGILGVIFGSGWLVWWVSQNEPSETPAPEIILTDDAARAAFLETQGISDSLCTATESIRLPVRVDAAYKAYADLQNAQRLPLTEHMGETAMRYTYTQSSPGQASLRTELLISENGVLLGAMQYHTTNAQQIRAILPEQ